MTDQIEPTLTNREVQAALGAMLSYLVLQVRQRDGVAAPPLLDRNDFLDYVTLGQDAPAMPSVDRQGWVWLAQQLRALGAQLPDEPPLP